MPTYPFVFFSIRPVPPPWPIFVDASTYQVSVQPQVPWSWADDDGASLAPVVLRYSVHKRYPSDEPPAFSVSSAWMGREDEESIKRAMAELFESQKGSVIIFAWVEWFLLCHRLLGSARAVRLPA